MARNWAKALKVERIALTKIRSSTKTVEGPKEVDIGNEIKLPIAVIDITDSIFNANKIEIFDISRCTCVLSSESIDTVASRVMPWILDYSSSKLMSISQEARVELSYQIPRTNNKIVQREAQSGFIYNPVKKENRIQAKRHIRCRNA